MKKKPSKSNAHKGTNGGATWPLSYNNPTVSAAGTNNNTAVLAFAEPKVEITVQMSATPATAGAHPPVIVTLELDREGRRACMLAALKAGLILTEYASPRSRLVGLYATAAEARSVVHQIRDALAAATVQPT